MASPSGLLFAPGRLIFFEKDAVREDRTLRSQKCNRSWARRSAVLRYEVAVVSLRYPPPSTPAREAVGQILGAIKGTPEPRRPRPTLWTRAPLKAEIADPGGGPIEIETARQRLVAMIERRAVVIRAAKVAPDRRLVPAGEP